MEKVSGKDIARRTGVSQSTVSLVLSGNGKSISQATQQLVMAAARELGYSRGNHSRKKQQKKKRIAAIVPNLESPVFPYIIKEINACAEKNNYEVYIFNIETEKEEIECSQALVSGMLDGAIFAFTPNNREIADIAEKNMPAVMLGERDDSLNINAVSLNSKEAGKLLAEHLYEIGRRSIAFVSGPSIEVSRAARLRYEGVLEKIIEFGGEKDFIALSQEDYKEDGIFAENVRSGSELTEKIIKEYPQINAVIAADDLICMGVYKAMQENMKNIPQDYAVCCFDDSVLTQSLYPPVTAVDYNTGVRVKIAFNMLADSFARSDNEKGVLKSISNSNLIIRKSTIG